MAFRFESTSTLLESDELDIWTAESDGCSSGYESASDGSDSGSLSHGSSVERLSSKTTSCGEMMNFKSTSALCDSLKFILSMPEMCDVTFLVGANEVPVYGVRAILGTRSRVFYQLILKHISQAETEVKEKRNRKFSAHPSKHAPRLTSRITIPVTKFDPEVFERLVQFVHCGSAEVNEKNVAGLLCAAVKFQLDDLRNACWDFVDRCLNAGKTEHLLSSAREYSQHRAATRLISKIYEHLDSEKKRSHSERSLQETTV